MMTEQEIVNTLEDIVLRSDSEIARIQAIKLLLELMKNEKPPKSAFDEIDELMEKRKARRTS